MSALRTVGIFGAISGVGLIGYYLFNKYKPTISEKQTESIKGQGYVLRLDTPEHRKLWAIVAQYSYDNVAKSQVIIDLKNKLLTQTPLIITDAEYNELQRAYSDMHQKNVFGEFVGKELAKLDSQKYWFEKRTQGIAEETFGFNKFGYGLSYQTNCAYNPSKGESNPCGYDYGKPFEQQIENGQYIGTNNYWRYAPNEYKDFFWRVPQPTGKDIAVVASNCVELDRHIKILIDRIADQTKNKPNENHRRVLAWYKDILEDFFEIHGCRDKIEKQRLLDSAKIQTLSAISQEKQVLGESQKSQNIYLGVGALVLLVSAGIIITNKN